MTVRRVVPNLACGRVTDTRSFYVDLLGFEVVMDLGWIVTVASPANPSAQVSLSGDGIGPGSDAPALTVEVADVDEVHDRAVAGGFDVVRPLVDEDWGVRRFFVRDPDGRVINVMSHPPSPG